MSTEIGAPAGLALYASSIAIEGAALLILGRSRSGKSRLAAVLVASSSRRQRIEFVGDDRILLRNTARGLEARPHPRIAGFVERRGLGLVATPWRETAVVAAVARLDEDAAPDAVELANLPCLSLVSVDEAERAAALLAWWQDMVERRCYRAKMAHEPGSR